MNREKSTVPVVLKEGYSIAHKAEGVMADKKVEVLLNSKQNEIGEVYNDDDGRGWGYFHYLLDNGGDWIDSRELAFKMLTDDHDEYVHNLKYKIKKIKTLKKELEDYK